MTRDQIVKEIAKRLNVGRVSRATWQDLMDAMAAMNTGQQNKLLNNLKNGQHLMVGRDMYNALREKTTTDTVAEAEAMLADDTLSLTEIEKIL